MAVKKMIAIETKKKETSHGFATNFVSGQAFQKIVDFLLSSKLLVYIGLSLYKASL